MEAQIIDQRGLGPLDGPAVIYDPRIETDEPAFL
jgi:hypothetical protein